MTDFEIVASALALFLGFGIAMGMLIVAVFSRGRRGSRYLGGGGWEEPPALPEDDGKHPWWYGR